MQLNLWELLSPIAAKLMGHRPGPPKVPPHRSSVRRPALAARPAGRVSADQAKYDAMVAELLELHGIKVRKWRKNSSGIARLTEYRDGRIVRTLESPYPRGPVSAGIFLHEVGHHVIGFGTYKPRCLEEFKAWEFAVAEMERRGLTMNDGLRDRIRRSLGYAVRKATRRGLRDLPPELLPYASPPLPAHHAEQAGPGRGTLTS